MSSDDFQKELKSYTQSFQNALATPSGDWLIKGFIDIHKNIYEITLDTKVISKIFELMIIPILQEFANKYDYIIEFSSEQNHYPDVTFIKGKQKIALDIKSTYRKGNGKVSGFTLGAFTGYFRSRDLNKNITYPYGEYSKHYILGIIYSRQEQDLDSNRIYKISDLGMILSIVKDFEFIIQEKYTIARDSTGSGNTKNIGSCTDISILRSGSGPFAEYGVKIFDDYWMHYMTKAMAASAEFDRSPYTNLAEYLKYRNIDNV